MINIVERYLGTMTPIRSNLEKGPSNRPIHKQSLGGVSDQYKKKRELERMKEKSIQNLKKKIVSQQINPMQNI